MIRRTYNRLGLSMLAYMLIYQLFSLPVMYVVMAFWPQLLQSSWFSVFVGEFVQYHRSLHSHNRKWIRLSFWNI